MAKILDDGEYTIEVTLNGGSGRSSIKSPTALTVEDGKMQAEIEWSSSNYDYMAVSNSDYYPVNTEGNSTFIIDVAEFDTEIPVSAETVAMSEPHTIDYTLYFDSSTVKKSGGNAYGVVLGSLGAVLIIAAAAAVMFKNTNHVRKGRMYDENIG